MTPSSNQSIVLAQRPRDVIVPGETFSSKTTSVPTEADLKDGQVVVEALYLSLDPAMRGWLNDSRSYIPPVKIGEIMRGGVIGRVAASKSSKLPVGMLVSGATGWIEYAVADDKDIQKVDVPVNGKATDTMGVLGMTGLTAYFGMLDVGKVKAGDFVVVSGAAGATGSVAGQIAKLKGATVLGLAGSDDKCAWLKSIGFDNALNYKDPDFASKFRGATKPLIDVFFDNVGGDILDLALSRAKMFSRFVICGAISQYNSSKVQGPSNYPMIIAMRITMQGFIVFDYEKQYVEARKDLLQWLEAGKIQRSETIVKGGLIVAEQTLVNLYKGVNTGKLLVEIKPENSPMAKL